MLCTVWKIKGKGSGERKQMRIPLPPSPPHTYSFLAFFAEKNQRNNVVK
jgi:hypothetical protein